MKTGPYLNSIKRSFTTRDSLGIEGINATMQADLCPVVNTVTPRAFYWAFLTWIYYDFYKYSGIEDRTAEAFDEYLKRQDYFFVMATILNEKLGEWNPAGITQAQKDIDQSDGPYPFNPNYLAVRFGGMQYYYAGCVTMQFLAEEDDQGNHYSLTKPTLLGEKMALAFERVIKNTEYYKNYRRNDKPVPKNVLEEYGKFIDLSLNGFDECKALLRHRLFEIDEDLSASAEYIKYLYDEYKIDNIYEQLCRKLFFDHLTMNGRRVIINESLKEVSDGWEIVVGRQYFTSGLEMIWKPMLEQIEAPKTKKKWFEDMFNSFDYQWDLDSKLGDVIKECNYDFDTREDIICNARKETTCVEDGLRILLSVYNWLKRRSDLSENNTLFLSYGYDSQSIPLIELISKVDEYLGHSIKDFLIFVMSEWLIKQHYITAFEKMLQGRDGFFYELTDGCYQAREQFDYYFQGIRMVRLMQVMKDLDMIK